MIFDVQARPARMPCTRALGGSYRDIQHLWPFRAYPYDWFEWSVGLVTALVSFSPPPKHGVRRQNKGYVKTYSSKESFRKYSGNSKPKGTVLEAYIF